MEIPCGEKSAMSETSNFWITFFTFFLKAASKKRKKSRFLDFQKNVKKRILELCAPCRIIRGQCEAVPHATIFLWSRAQYIVFVRATLVSALNRPTLLRWILAGRQITKIIRFIQSQQNIYITRSKERKQNYNNDDNNNNISIITCNFTKK